MKRLLFAVGVLGVLIGAGLALAMVPPGGGNAPQGRPQASPSLSSARPSPSAPAQGTHAGFVPGGGRPANFQRPSPQPGGQQSNFQRPQISGVSRLNIAALQRPQIQRPASLPGGVHLAGTTPSQGPNLGALANRPGGMLPQRPGFASSGGAANKPMTLPGMAGVPPSTLPGLFQRPGAGGSTPLTSSSQGGGGGGSSWAANRPGWGGGQARPQPLPGGLLGQGNRPGQGGSIVEPNRPGSGGIQDGTRPGQGGGMAGSWSRPGGIFGPNRPGQGGSNSFRPHPGLVNRPGEGGGGTQWNWGDHARPDGWRPGGDNRPGQRPGAWQPGGSYWSGPRPGGIWGQGNPPGSNIGSGNTIVGGNTINQSTNNFTNVTNQQQWLSGNWNSGNRYGGGWGANYGAYSGRGYGFPSYYSGTLGDWYAGSWSNWRSYPALWLTTATAGWLGAPAIQNYVYDNPYAVNLAATSFQPAYSYSDPIPASVEPQSSTAVLVNAPQGDMALVNAPQPAAVPATPGLVGPGETTAAAETPEQAPPEDPKVKEAMALFDEGRRLFKDGDSAGAQAKADKAIGIVPQDRALHEFRALALFAQGKYQDAAATLYAVLSGGPGWNWDTVRSFYPNVNIYTQQLRALEAHARENPRSADDRFVLAYHYLVIGQPDAAVKELEQVHNLLPDDQLSAQILTALKPRALGVDDAPRANTG